MAIEIVSFPMKNGDFQWLFVSLPEGTPSEPLPGTLGLGVAVAVMRGHVARHGRQHGGRSEQNMALRHGRTSRKNHGSYYVYYIYIYIFMMYIYISNIHIDNIIR